MKIRVIAFYTVVAIAVAFMIWYINADITNNSLTNYINVWQKSSEITVGEYEILPPTSEEISSAIEKTRYLNLNTATKSELVALETIGDVTAKKIITFREENGYFNSINELLSNDLITKRQFDAIKEQITV